MTTAFIHEGIIYEYMNERFDTKNLFVYRKILKGNVVQKESRVPVKYLEKITNTRFPDVDNITLQGSKELRSAEVKFVTSSFNYHKDKNKKREYNNFKDREGFIIVLKHDYLPPDLIMDYPQVDVYELDYNDFISFARENFNRLLNRQLKLRHFSRIWIMMQSKNFSVSADGVLAAKESNIWCPSDNLNSFDLDVGDKVIFIKTSGSSYQSVNKEYSSNKQIKYEWKLQELYVGVVTSRITSRAEYCSRNKKSITSPLWYDETPTGISDPRVTSRKSPGERWKKVFEFQEKYTRSDLNIELHTLHEKIPDFVVAILGAFCQQTSREISQNTYEALLEYLSDPTN